MKQLLTISLLLISFSLTAQITIEDETPVSYNFEQMHKGEPSGYIFGTVADENGMPLHGALVYTSNGLSGTTNKFGQYCIRLMEGMNKSHQVDTYFFYPNHNPNRINKLPGTPLRMILQKVDNE